MTKSTATAKTSTAEANVAADAQTGEVLTVLAAVDEPKRLNGKQLNQLTAPLNQNRVSSRRSAGSNLSYVEAWDIKRTLIRVFGFGNFSADVIDSKILRTEQVAQVKDANKTNWEISAQATVKLTIHLTGATYTETAIGGSKQPDFTEAADMAIKTAESDALKRAAIYLGTQFGLSLYNEGSTQDVVGVILDEDQSAELAAWHKEVAARREAQAAAQQPNAPQNGSAPANVAPNPAQGVTAAPSSSGTGTIAGAFAHPEDGGQA